MYWASYVSGAGVLQRSETVAPTRGVRNWRVSVTGFGTYQGRGLRDGSGRRCNGMENARNYKKKSFVEKLSKMDNLFWIKIW